MARPTIIFLTGSIGAGKSTLGRELAGLLSGQFIDRDDHQVPGISWYAGSLRTSRRILEVAVAALPQGQVVIGFPLRCFEWIYFRRHLAAAGAATVFVGLSVAPTAILAAERGRSYSGDERRRIREMVSQGYDRPRLVDLLFAPGAAPPRENARRLLAELQAQGLLTR